MVEVSSILLQMLGMVSLDLRTYIDYWNREVQIWLSLPLSLTYLIILVQVTLTKDFACLQCKYHPTWRIPWEWLHITYWLIGWIKRIWLVNGSGSESQIWTSLLTNLKRHLNILLNISINDTSSARFFVTIKINYGVNGNAIIIRRSTESLMLANVMHILFM
jgi:hypothetical protein